MSTNNQHSGQVVLEVNDLRTFFTPAMEWFARLMECPLLCVKERH